MINANDIGIPIDKEFWFYLLNFALKLSELLKFWNSRFFRYILQRIVLRFEQNSMNTDFKYSYNNYGEGYYDFWKELYAT